MKKKFSKSCFQLNKRNRNKAGGLVLAPEGSFGRVQVLMAHQEENFCAAWKEVQWKIEGRQQRRGHQRNNKKTVRLLLEWRN